MQLTSSIVVADDALKAGETSLVTITFSEAVSDFTNADLSVANGTLTAVSSVDGVTWTATLTPTADIEDTDNLITLANASVLDAAGNANSGTTDSNNYAIDTLRLLKARYAPQSELVYVQGSDSVQGLESWRQPEDILKEFLLLVLQRKGMPIFQPTALMQRYAERIFYVDLDLPEISSTQLRDLKNR